MTSLIGAQLILSHPPVNMPPKSTKVKSATNNANAQAIYPQQWDPTPHLQTLQPIPPPQLPLQPPPPPAFFPTVSNSVDIADENFDSRFQVNIAVFLGHPATNTRDENRIFIE